MTAVSTPRSPTAGVEAESVQRSIAVVVAHVIVFVIGFDFRPAVGVSLALGAALVLVPVWLQASGVYPLARAIGVLGAASIVAGLVLSEFSASDHGIDASAQRSSIALLLSGLAAFVLLLWARQVLPLHRIMCLYGAGAVAGSLYLGQTSWKYSLAIPVTILCLGVVESRDKRGLAAALVVVLGVVGVLDEGRSLLAFCVLAAALTLWQLRPRASDKNAHRWAPAVVMAVVGAVLYFVAVALLTGGALGTEVQARSEMQIEQSGSLISGGRPEWSATRELLFDRPQGYGIGVVPSWSDYMAGKEGLASINIDGGGYTKNYMFGGSFELHSIVADLWVDSGWVGVAFGVLIGYAILRSLSLLLSRGEAPTSVLFVGIFGLWFLLFGPMASNWLDVCVAASLTIAPAELLRRDERVSLDQDGSREKA